MRQSIFALLCCAFSAFANASQGPRPTATPDVAATQPGVAVLIPVMHNDIGLGPDPCLLSASGTANGRVRVVGDLVRYTPRPGFAGVDEFTYRAQATGGGRIVRGHVTVTVGAAAQLRLQGRVVDAPAAGALVEASLGATDFSTTTDAAGNYSLNLPASGAGMVILSVTGTGATGAAVDFRSVVGDLSRLLEEAGTDRVLTSAENHQVNASALSTAHFVLTERLNGGDAPSTDARLAELTQSTDAAEMVAMAASMQLILQGNEPVPAGFASAFELVQNATALTAFQTGLDPGELDGAIASLLETAGVAPTFDPASLSTEYGIIQSRTPNAVTPSSIPVRLLELDGVGGTSGTGRALDDFAHPTPEADWQIVGSVALLFVNIPNPRTFFDFVLDDTCIVGGREALTGVVQVSVRRLIDGDGYDVVQFLETSRTTPIETPDCLPTPPPSFATTTSFVLSFELAGGSNAEIPFAAPTRPASVALYRPAVPAQSDNWTAEIYPFDTTPTSPSTWFIQNGRLFVNHADGQVIESIHLQSDGGKGRGLFNVTTLPGGVRAVSYSLSVAVDGTGAITFDNLAGLHVNGFTQAAQPSVQLGRFLMRLDADGNARTVSETANGTCSMTLHTWRVEGGRMLADRVPRNGVVGYRNWIPLARSGARLYVIEDIGIGFQGPAESQDVRPNFYNLTTPTSTCASEP